MDSTVTWPGAGCRDGTFLQGSYPLVTWPDAFMIIGSNSSYQNKRSLAFILSLLFIQTHVQEMGCSLPSPGCSTGWNSSPWPCWAGGGDHLDEAYASGRTVMGNGTIKADWGQPGEASECEGKKHPCSAQQPRSQGTCRPRHTSAVHLLDRE